MGGTTYSWFGGTGDIITPSDWSPAGVPSPGNTYLIAGGAPSVDPATEIYIQNTTFTLAGTASLGAPTVRLLNGADLVATLQINSPSVAAFGTVEIMGNATLGHASTSATAPSANSGMEAFGAAGSELSLVLQDSGATPAALTLAGDADYIAAGNFSNTGDMVSIGGAADGALLLDSGGLSAVNQGTLTVGVAVSSDAGFDGSIQVSTGATVDLQRSVAASETAMLFGGLLQLDDPAEFAGQITDFQAGATLELANTSVVGFSQGTILRTLEPLSLTTTSGRLLLDLPPNQGYTITQSGPNALLTVGSAPPADPGGPAGGSGPPVDIDTNGTITVSVPATVTTPSGPSTTPATVVGTVPRVVTFECFVAGTRIATEGGEVPVEALRPGMRVRTRSGLRPVRWVGRRRLDLRRHADAAAAAPLRIRADAFGPGLPARDLFLSSDHAVFAAGALIPIRCLANGATVAREDRAKVAYYHVELDRHDVLFAEGLPAESYLDTGTRANFEGEAVLALHPRFAPKSWTADACAPLLTHGAAVAAERARLVARAEALGFMLTTDPGLHVRAGTRTLAVAPGGYPLPGRVRALRLCSRRVVPQEIDPRSDDRRRLGLALRGVWFDEQPAAASAFGAGFHPAEPDGPRWTDGDAVLHVPEGARRLRLGVDIWQRYWHAPSESGVALTTSLAR